MTRNVGIFLALGLVAIVITPASVLPAVVDHSVRFEAPHVLTNASVDFEFSTLGLLALLLAAPVFGALVAALRWSKAWRAIRRLKADATTDTLAGIAFWELDLPGVAVFTAGFMRPEIYASRHAQRTLSPDSFRAALLHEAAHASRRDPAIRGLLTLTATSFWWSRSIRAFVDRAVLRQEIRCDEAAIATGATRLDLLEAVTAAAAGGPAAPSIADADVEKRLLCLASQGAAPDQGPPQAVGILATWAIGIPLLSIGFLLAH